MGGGSWRVDDYAARAASRAATGRTTFHYSDTTSAAPRSSWTVNDRLDPKKVAGDGSPHAGKVMRESRDSDEHPASVAIVVALDVTGSMTPVIKTIHSKLPELYGLLLRKGYVTDPQVLFMGVGDATCDRVPLQAGQFESDNRADEDLEALFLENGGGGQSTESYELAAYFVARHTATDCWEKRAHRGYFFIIGDERFYAKVNRTYVANLIGDDLEADVPSASVFAELGEKWDTYLVHPMAGGHGGEENILKAWREVLGQNVLLLDDATAVCEVIALAVGLGEGTIDLDTGADDLADAGVDAATIAAARKSLVPVAAGAAAPATASGALPPVPGAGGVDRL